MTRMPVLRHSFGVLATLLVLQRVLVLVDELGLLHLGDGHLAGLIGRLAALRGGGLFHFTRLLHLDRLRTHYIDVGHRGKSGYVCCVRKKNWKVL